MATATSQHLQSIRELRKFAREFAATWDAFSEGKASDVALASAESDLQFCAVQFAATKAAYESERDHGPPQIPPR